MGLTYPEISPIMLQIGPIAIRWYSMAYLFGIVFGWLLIRHYVKKYALRLSSAQLEDFVFYLTLGIILGGRIGYVLFYGEKVFQDNWWEVFAIWKGGMSFHGGALGVITAMALFAKFSTLRIQKVVDYFFYFLISISYEIRLGVLRE